MLVGCPILVRLSNLAIFWSNFQIVVKLSNLDNCLNILKWQTSVNGLMEKYVSELTSWKLQFCS